jgi:hypothetical protein
MLVRLLLVASLAIFSIFPTHAKLVECLDCYSDLSYLNLAKSRVDLVEGVSYIYVSNSNIGEIKKFKLRYGSGSSGDPALFIVTPVAVDSATQNMFSDAMYYRNSIKDFFEYHQDVPRDVALSAWQLAGNSVFQRDIAAYYSSNQSLRDLIGNYTATLTTLGGKLIAANLTVTVKFSDDSSALYKIVGLDSNGNLEFEFFKATDHLGNPIPTSPTQLEGQLKMDRDTLSNYQSAVNRFRFSFRAGSISIPQGSVIIVDCVVDPETKDVTCKSTKP